MILQPWFVLSQTTQNTVSKNTNRGYNIRKYKKSFTRYTQKSTRNCCHKHSFSDFQLGLNNSELGLHVSEPGVNNSELGLHDFL